MPTRGPSGTGHRSTALLTDHYELTMLAAARHAGVADHPAVFEAYARRLPSGRRYGVVAGLGRLLDALAAFRFGAEELEFLSRTRVVDDGTLSWLADYRFTGSVVAYPEGELYFPDSPVLRVEGTFGEAVLLETIVLSHLNYDSAVASAAARMVTAARDRRLMEFGGRRTQEGAAVAAARAAYVAGFDSTSNLEAGRRYGIPTVGTSAHAFTLVFLDEAGAFHAQVEALGPQTTLLVDTYNLDHGLRHAVEAAGPQLGAVRIDSGDLTVEIPRARALLDKLGATTTRILASSDLDEYAIDELADAPVDAFGVGTRLVTGSGAPTGEFVYKLVAVADEPGGPLRNVEKGGGVKATVGGRKRAWRELDADGIAVAEVVAPDDAIPPTAVRELQLPLVIDGDFLPAPSLAEIRDTHAAAKRELPAEAHRLDPGEPAIPTRRSPQ